MNPRSRYIFNVRIRNHRVHVSALQTAGNLSVEKALPWPCGSRPLSRVRKEGRCPLWKRFSRINGVSCWVGDHHCCRPIATEMAAHCSLVRGRMRHICAIRSVGSKVKLGHRPGVRTRSGRPTQARGCQMRRGIFTTAAIVSLLLGVAAIVFWVRSYDFGLAANDRFAAREVEVYSVRGRLTIASRRKPTTSRMLITTAPDGSQIVTHYVQSYAPTHSLEVSYFLIVLITAVLPTAWLICFSRPARRRRLKRQGRCLICGYDLAGNASGVCPECGTPIPQSPVAKILHRQASEPLSKRAPTTPPLVTGNR